MVEEPVLSRWFDEVGKRGLDGPALLAEARALLQARLVSEAAVKRTEESGP